MGNEKRLIDYEVARNATYEEVFWTESEQAVVRNFLAKLPKVDAVEVVHGRRIPLEAFLHPIDVYKGLKAKYLVFKADTGEKVDNCFILRPGKDPAAAEALRAYARATDNETLAEDIYNWVGKSEPVQEWISVEAGELKNYIGVPVCIKRKTDGECWWTVIRGIKNDKLSTDYGGYFMLSEYRKTWLVICCNLPQPPQSWCHVEELKNAVT